MTTILTAAFAAWVSVCFIVLVAFALIIHGGTGDARDDEWN